MNPENEGWSAKHRIQFAKEEQDRVTKQFMNRVGRDEISKRRVSIDEAMRTFNRVFGSSNRLSLQTIDAMIIAVDSVPFSVDMKIVHMPKFREMHEILHAIRVILIEERDAKLKELNPSLSTDRLDNESKQA